MCRCCASCKADIACAEVCRASFDAVNKSNSLPRTAPTESSFVLVSGNSSMRRASNAAACREDCTSARARGSARHPVETDTSAPDSTSPRRAAAAMNGLPSARRSITSTASSGKGPAIDSTSLRMLDAGNAGSVKCSVEPTARSGWLAGTSSDRKATTKRTGHSAAACRRRQLLSTWTVNWSAHWQSSSRTSAGRPVAPRASRSAVSA